ncbi:hypothetical protein D1BOALGB6SA_8706 [Olavius sp. associated proteobacterium Delta 1]|nr:hypothetical protein D1BOALGB6SA_8706 [Olavius sp. associated proteobacterium Delta 1]
MNIWVLQIGEPLPIEADIRKLRTTILSEKLTDNGHSVLWWASAFDHFKKDWVFREDKSLELKQGIKIIALKGTGYQKNISLSRYIDHRIIARKFRKMAPKLEKPDIIVASMPSYDLAYEALNFAGKNNIPIMVDIRDEWPDIFLRHVPPAIRTLVRLLLHKDFAMFKKLMQKADGLLAMMDSLLEWGIKHARRKRSWRDRIFYLGYQINTNNLSNKILKLVEPLGDSFIVTFIGTFASYHNPSILLDCAAKLKGNNIHFILAGDGEHFKKIEKRASNVSNIILPGWLNQGEITTLLKHSHIGVCTTTQDANFLPNKAFAYLSAGLPILSAFGGELKLIIEKYQIGFYYPPHDLATLTSHIKRLYEDRILYKKMSINASQVFNNMFDADKIYEDYSRHIEKIVDEYRRTH